MSTEPKNGNPEMGKAIMLKKLHDSEIQFKLALAVWATCESSDERLLKYIGTFSYGKHIMSAKELTLTAEEEKRAAVILEHSATYFMALQLDDILIKLFPDPTRHQDANIRNGAQIIHLIRNAYAHDPLEPTWRIPHYCENQIITIEKIISLNTAGLDGKTLKQMDYGGPISLLRLVQYFEQVIQAT